jgi:hypothetical protein
VSASLTTSFGSHGPYKKYVTMLFVSCSAAFQAECNSIDEFKAGAVGAGCARPPIESRLNNDL